MNPNQNGNLDLLVQKTAEFDNLPGLILGLDGWILRSVPKELRDQFLRGYEKLLRIVFHPDRYRNEDQKKSRLNYLQSVSEAVRFMLADEFAFEMASDTVPTRQNPVLTLRKAVEVRDSIIKRVDVEIVESKSALEDAKKEIARLQKELSRWIARYEAETFSNGLLRQFAARLAKRFPVPISFERAQVTGFPVVIKPETEFADLLAKYSGESVLGPEQTLVTKNEWVDFAKGQGVLTKETVLNFKKGTAMNLKGEFQARIVGAMTLGHLCDYVRRSHQGKVQAALKELQTPETDWDKVSQTTYRSRVWPFLVPFYSDSTFLLLQQGPLEYGLFWVEKVDAGEDPQKALADSLRNETRLLYLQLSKIRKQKKDLRHELSVSKSEATMLSRKLKPAYRAARVNMS